MLYYIVIIINIIIGQKAISLSRDINKLNKDKMVQIQSIFIIFVPANNIMDFTS